VGVFQEIPGSPGHAERMVISSMSLLSVVT
jgi:hypothetical protein